MAVLIFLPCLLSSFVIFVLTDSSSVVMLKAILSIGQYLVSAAGRSLVFIVEQLFIVHSLVFSALKVQTRMEHVFICGPLLIVGLFSQADMLLLNILSEGKKSMLKVYDL